MVYGCDRVMHNSEEQKHARREGSTKQNWGLAAIEAAQTSCQRQ